MLRAQRARLLDEVFRSSHFRVFRGRITGENAYHKKKPVIRLRMLTDMKLLSTEDSPTPQPSTDRPPTHRGLTVGLAWFSIGLGLAQLLAPKALSRLIGV